MPRTIQQKISPTPRVGQDRRPEKSVTRHPPGDTYLREATCLSNSDVTSVRLIWSEIVSGIRHNGRVQLPPDVRKWGAIPASSRASAINDALFVGGFDLLVVVELGDEGVEVVESTTPIR